MAVQGCRTNSEIPRIPYNELSLEEFQVSDHGVKKGVFFFLKDTFNYLHTFKNNSRNLTLNLHDQ